MLCLGADVADGVGDLLQIIADVLDCFIEFVLGSVDGIQNLVDVAHGCIEFIGAGAQSAGGVEIVSGVFFITGGEVFQAVILLEDNRIQEFQDVAGFFCQRVDTAHHLVGELVDLFNFFGGVGRKGIDFTRNNRKALAGVSRSRGHDGRVASQEKRLRGNGLDGLRNVYDLGDDLGLFNGSF